MLEGFDYPGNRGLVNGAGTKRIVRLPKNSCAWIAVRPNSAHRAP
jgi:hypothetical protein